jgi:hypothetical protein
VATFFRRDDSTLSRLKMVHGRRIFRGDREIAPAVRPETPRQGANRVRTALLRRIIRPEHRPSAGVGQFIRPV